MPYDTTTRGWQGAWASTTDATTDVEEEIRTEYERAREQRALNMTQMLRQVQEASDSIITAIPRWEVVPLTGSGEARIYPAESSRVVVDESGVIVTPDQLQYLGDYRTSLAGTWVDDVTPKDIIDIEMQKSFDEMYVMFRHMIKICGTVHLPSGFTWATFMTMKKDKQIETMNGLLNCKECQDVYKARLKIIERDEEISIDL
jgi:hypothetical protein